MKPKIMTIEARTTKNGAPIACRFVVTQTHEYPYIDGRPTYPNWRRDGQVFADYNGRAQGIGRKYRAQLLRLDLKTEELPENYDRTHFAGFTNYETHETAPTLTLRGQTLGEIDIQFDITRADWTQTETNGPTTPAAREWTKETFLPALIEFANANKRELFADAVETIEKTISNQLAEMRKYADKLEAESAAAVAKLKGDTLTKL